MKRDKKDVSLRKQSNACIHAWKPFLPACCLTGSLPGSVKRSVSMNGACFDLKNENSHQFHLVANQQKINLQHLMRENITFVKRTEKKNT